MHASLYLIYFNYNKYFRAWKIDVFGRLDNLEVKVDNLEVKVHNLEVKVDNLAVKVDNLDNKLDSMGKMFLISQIPVWIMLVNMMIKN